MRTMSRGNPWWERAKCRDADPKIFDSRKAFTLGPDNEVVKNKWVEARTLCAACPVQRECLAWALSFPPHDGDDRQYIAGYEPHQIKQMKLGQPVTSAKRPGD